MTRTRRTGDLTGAALLAAAAATAFGAWPLVDWRAAVLWFFAGVLATAGGYTVALDRTVFRDDPKGGP